MISYNQWREAVETPCLTPGANFSTHIKPKEISMNVKFPKEINLSKKEAQLLEKNLHNAIELVLRYYFK